MLFTAAKAAPGASIPCYLSALQASTFCCAVMPLSQTSPWLFHLMLMLLLASVV
jgi:hypothetical protein